MLKKHWMVDPRVVVVFAVARRWLQYASWHCMQWAL
jgi:hypothetical protein